MKKPFFTRGLVALFLLLLASQLLLNFAHAPRTWLQKQIIQIDYDAQIIFESVLGEHYIITPTGLYYPGDHPYYYTHFDALYHWIALDKSQSFKACSKSSNLCIPGVYYSAYSYSEEFFNYHINDIYVNPGSPFTHYCIDGIHAIGKKDELHNGETSFPLAQWISIYTIHGTYTLSSMTEAQQEQWMQRCPPILQQQIKSIPLRKSEDMD